jgi:hypothetical protein
MAEYTRRGIIESQSRILEDLLEKTAFKDGLRHFLNNIDPENSPNLIRTLMGKDIEVTLALMAALPALANAIILALDELISQVREKFPPALLADFTKSLLDDIDKEALARVMTGGKELGDQLSPVFKAAGKAAHEQGKEGK